MTRTIDTEPGGVGGPPSKNSVMGGVSRRRFIAGAAGAAAGLMGPVRSLARTPLGAAGTTIFTSGVASGDPAIDGVVLWTRVDPDRFHASRLLWEVFPAGDPSTVLRSGEAVVDGERDGTVQVVADGLPSGAALGYRFTAEKGLGGPPRATQDGRPAQHVEGLTRTLPGDPRRLRVGVVSCGKYSDGYFSAYRTLAAMDCDLVLHLGDYIYASAGEGTSDPLGRWDSLDDRPHDPPRETAALADYRVRYQQYRADGDLARLHASVPVVAVWDDNDIANNAWRDGNQAGEPPEVWFLRKRDAQRAWSEYHPTRVGPADADGNLAIWRRIRAGSLLDLFMLDTRLQRDQQVSNAAAGSTAQNDDPARTMLGPDQKQWLVDALAAGGRDDVAWRVLGQGIVMTHWRVVGPPEPIGRLRKDIPLVQDTAVATRLADGGVYWNSDGWDGYTAERADLYEAFGATGDVIVLTGDVHSSWANELVPGADPLNEPVGVEFVAPAASTRPFASNVYGATPVFEAAFTAANPWIKFCDMDANGFLVVDLEEERAVAQWFQVDAQTPGADASRFAAWVTERGSRRLLPFVG